VKQKALSFGSVLIALALLALASGPLSPANAFVNDKAQVTIVVLPTNTPRGGPAVASTPTAASSAALRGSLCRDCSRVRLRKTPGTAGEIVVVIPEASQFTLVGRTADLKWMQVQLDSGEQGWLSAQFVRQPDRSIYDAKALQSLPVAGAAIDASPTPTSAFTASAPPWLTGITAHSRQIYLQGQRMGNRANVFSRVGDSITASENFLYPIGWGQYVLGQYGYLGDVIGYFSQANARTGNSFASAPLAAGGGWTTERLLMPGGSTPQICGSDTPIECEYKHVHPAIALIMIGTNDSGSGSPDVFAGNLSRIIETTINMGIIPVLSTIPPKNLGEDQENRVNTYNGVITQIARRYDIPLWDYYSNMVNAPNRGLSSDGLHPSISPFGSGRFTPDSLLFGYTIRNLNALQVLDAVWRLTMY